jgi:hypothetical protein
MEKVAVRIKGVALADREGYFMKGDQVEVRKVTGSVYRVFGLDPLGYPYTCLTSSRKIEITEDIF